MLIGISQSNELWIEVSDPNDQDCLSVTTDGARAGRLRPSSLDMRNYVNYSINTYELVKALVAMRDTSLWKDEVRAFLRKKNIVGAIKVWRTYTGCSLKEAKDEVDKLRAEEGL